MVTAAARRVDSFDGITQAGDYYLDWITVEGERRRHLWFLLPIHEGATVYDRPTPGSGLHGISEPPWTFRECADGSVEARASIACGRGGPDGEYFHGYLDEGNTWRYGI